MDILALLWPLAIDVRVVPDMHHLKLPPWRCRYATLIMARDAAEMQEEPQHGRPGPRVSTLTHLLSLAEEEEHEWAALAQMQAQSDPQRDILKRPSALGAVKLGGPAASLRPPLQGCRLLLITVRALGGICFPHAFVASQVDHMRARSLPAAPPAGLPPAAHHRQCLCSTPLE